MASSLTSRTCLLASFVFLSISPSFAGGLEGAVDTRLIKTTVNESIYDGFRDLNSMTESRSSWSGSADMAQSFTDTSIKIDGLRMNADAGDLLSDPLIRVSTTSGLTQTSMTAEGTDYSQNNARVQEHYTSTSLAEEIGSRASTFGRTF